jgi:hypothetical protein
MIHECTRVLAMKPGIWLPLPTEYILQLAKISICLPWTFCLPYIYAHPDSRPEDMQITTQDCTHVVGSKPYIWLALHTH